MKNYTETFIDAIRAHGMTPPTGMTSGEIYRFPGAGKKDNNKAGWALLFLGGTGGMFGDFSTGLSLSWHEKRDSAMTKSESDEFLRQVKKARQEAEETKRVEQAAAAKRAMEIWQKATPARDDHPYLKRKGVKPFCLCQDKGGRLIAPIQSMDGKIHSLQFINEDGGKRFLRNGRIDSCFFFIDDDFTTDETICIAEGFATAASIHEATSYLVAVAFNAGNLKAVAEAILEMYPDNKIIICADDDFRTDGNPGVTKATEAALAISSWLAIPNFGSDRQEGMTDFNDLQNHHGLEAVRSCIQTARPAVELSAILNDTDSSATLDGKREKEAERIARLATLSLIEYDRIRDAEAKAIGVRATTLDQAVKEARKSCGTDSALPFREIEPWPEKVSPVEVLSEVAAVIRRFIICDHEISIAVALWVAMTWFLDVIQVCPLAIIKAPEKRCGKTQLLTVIGRLVCRAITASSISPAALFRAIDAWKPTLLIDETDACLKDNEELRGIINSGHTRDSAYVIRTVGETFTPTKFSTWGPKALSGIGHLADTLMDRAIILELRRKLSHESVHRLRYAELSLFENLPAKLARFAIDYSEQVREARPSLPFQLNDRAQDNWEPLLAIADVAGGEWPERARAAALKLSGSSESNLTIGVELLTDIQEIFDTKAVDRIGTADLIKALIEDEEKPWAGYNRGFPIKPRQVSKRLADYGISSNTIRVGLLTMKGYKRDQFTEAFARYLSSDIAKEKKNFFE